jgi:hypothetical protein
MITTDELDAMNRRIQAVGAANCWTGTTGTLAADARRMVNALRSRDRPRLIGLHGPAGCGKDLAASMVPGARRVGFADPLYRGLAAMLGIPEERLRDRAEKERRVGAAINASPRRLLQTLGSEWGRSLIDHDLWVKLARARWREALGDFGCVVVPDVRFANEADAIRADGGVIWLVYRPNVAAVAPHESENGIPLEMVDSLVVNTGTVDELRERVTETLGR